MLVLTRTVGTSFEMPSLGIKVTVVAVKGSKILLGVEAPRDVDVLRSELLERIQGDES